MEPRFIRVRDIESAGYGLKKTTCYKWNCLGIHREIFRKVRGSLFISVEALEQLYQSSVPRSLAR
ncbi:MAG: hypothetical protein ACLQVJ_12350 [Syntrophobacteraceae bacterium]